MHDNEKSNSAKQIHALNQEIIKLRKRLNELDDQKEAVFAKKNAVSKTIRELIAQAKEKRVERNRITDSVKEEKQTRENLNSTIRSKIDEINALKKQLAGKSKTNEGNPAKIKIIIENLDEKIEREVMSFEKETKIMKQIRGLKKSYDELTAGNAVWAKINTLSLEVDALKKDADSKHRGIQEKARVSQEKHENVLEVSKKIDELREEEKKLREEFAKKKKEFLEVNANLKDKLAEFAKLNESNAVHAASARRAGESKIKHYLKEKLKRVQEKLQDRKKLTTEDILILQLEESKENK